MVLIVFLNACSTEAVQQKVMEITTVDTIPPVFLGCKTVSSKEITFEFSLPVEVSSLDFAPPHAVSSITGGATVQVLLVEAPPEGEKIKANLLVEDKAGNTLEVLVPFRARNDRLPALVITEVRTKHTKPKADFVEFKTLSAGNLAALRLFTATFGMEEPLLEFPPVEVAEGEYILVHLRTWEEGTKDETGTDLGASGGTEAFPESRDFWLPESEERLKETDAVFFLDQDGLVVDGVLLNAGDGKFENLADAVELFGSQGKWNPPEGGAGTDYVPKEADAVASKDTTTTRSICRWEEAPNTHSAADWYITASSGATPGKPNKTTVYEARQTTGKKEVKKN
jgi:hypothetical protein